MAGHVTFPWRFRQVCALSVVWMLMVLGVAPWLGSLVVHCRRGSLMVGVTWWVGRLGGGPEAGFVRDGIIFMLELGRGIYGIGIVRDG